MKCLLLAALISGCYSSADENACEGSFRLCEGFSAREQDLITHAADHWDAGIHIDPTGTCPISRAPLAPNVAAHYDHAGRIEVNAALTCESDACWVHMMAHEFGHSIGLRHTVGGVMDPNAYEAL